jgi:GNAT superfamily N-acetyltransferase
MNAQAAMDRRWALQLQCDEELLHEPGLHVVRGRDLEVPFFMSYYAPFLAIFPDHTPNCAVVLAEDHVCDEIEAWEIRERDASRSNLESRLLGVARGLGLEDAYIFDILAADSSELRLDLDPVVQRFGAGSLDVLDWDGTPIGAEVDGTLFATFDKHGMTAWAGEKMISPVARDFQVGTREDVRRQGLARKVSSHAIQEISNKGMIPYYAHFRENVPSAQLALALGFHPYGSAVAAESRISN